MPGGEPERDPTGAGLVLRFTTPGLAAIQDEGQTLPSRRNLATIVHDFQGWTLTVHGRGAYGPFGSAEEGARWYAANRAALPEPARPRLLSDDWPPRE
jgi:hypothetical protein